MTAGFEIHPSGLRGIAASLRDDADFAAQAGVSLAGLNTALRAPAAGDSLSDVLTQFSKDWCVVLEEMSDSLTHLAGWVDDAATSYFSVDSEIAYRLGDPHR